MDGTDIVVNLAVGVGSNVAWDMIKRRSVILPRLAYRREPGGGDLLWSLPAAVLPILMFYLARHRWASDPWFALGVMAAACVAGVVVMGMVRAIGAPRTVPPSGVWMLWVMLLGVPVVTLDDMMPRGVALDCGTAATLTNPTIEGRVTPDVRRITLSYGPVGRAQFTLPVAISGDDRVFSARIEVDPRRSEPWEVSATTAEGGRSNRCLIGVR